MWARARLDIGYLDLLSGLRYLLDGRSRDRVAAQLEGLWSDRGDALACYSVRSGFDLVLQALDLPPRSEILLSALNIKGMVKIVQRLELVPVPVDLDFATLRPDPAAIEAAITPRTRAIVVAPLFGARYDMSPIVTVARRHGLRVIEDCAQAFCGLGFSGSEEADVSMFSFGPLKFATALGGALLRVRDPGLLARMRAIQDGYPVAGRRDFASRVVKFGGLKLLTSRPLLGAVARLFRMRGRDYEDSVSNAVRGVAKLGSAARIRKRPPTAMLLMMRRRISRFRPARLEPRHAQARALLELLPQAAPSPGVGNEVHNFWAFPVVVQNPVEVMQKLRRAGFDAATLRRSQAIAAPPDRPELEPRVARETLAHLLVLPCYPGMPHTELARQADIVRASAVAPDMPAPVTA